MHLMPVYYNSLSTKRKKKKKVNPQKYETQWRQHNKFLKSIRCPIIKYKPKEGKCFGSTTVSKTVRRGSTPCPSATPSIGNGIGNALKKERPTYNGNVVIGQAYNKGGLQVLSTQEANDPDTGKRR